MEKKNYQFCHVAKKGEGAYNVTLKAWVVESEKSKPSFSTATIGGVNKDVANFVVGATVAKSKMKFLGLPEADTMFLRCSAMAEPKEGIVTVVDRLKKANLRKGHMLLLVGTVVKKTSEDGKTYTTFYVDDFDIEVRPKKKEETANEEVEENIGVSVTEDGDMPF